MIKSNGKGITKEYSEASAYAEFIERLQTLLNSFIYYDFCQIDTKSVYVSEKTFDEIDLKKLNKIFLNKIDKYLPMIKKDVFLSYYDVFNKSFEYLPFTFLRHLFRSTGLASGNNFYEATSQAICEIMERYSLTIACNNKEYIFPDIELKELDLKSFQLKKIINSIERENIKITVKDCTLGGQIPVLCTLLEDCKTNAYAVSFGSDSVFEVALLRCITEAYQGFEKIERKIPINALKTVKHFDLYNESFFLLERMKKNGKKSNYKNAFVNQKMDHKSHFEFLLDKIKKMGFNIYIRDFSCLGFPTVNVFIPEMILNEKCFKENLDFTIKGFLDLIYNLPNVSKEKLNKFCEYFHYHIDKMEIEILGFLNPGKCQLPINKFMDLKKLVVFLYLEANEYSKLKIILDHGYERAVISGEGEEIDFKNIIMQFCNLKEMGKADEQILSDMEKKHLKTSYKDSLRHLINKNYASFYKKENNNSVGFKFDGLEIPKCIHPVKCLSCHCKKNCYLDELIKLQHQIRKNYIKIDQNSVLEKCIPRDF